LIFRLIPLSLSGNMFDVMLLSKRELAMFKRLFLEYDCKRL